MNDYLPPFTSAVMNDARPTEADVEHLLRNIDIEVWIHRRLPSRFPTPLVSSKRLWQYKYRTAKQIGSSNACQNTFTEFVLLRSR